MRARFVAGIAAGFGFVAGIAAVAACAANSPDQATIVNSGSTNTTGYKLSVSPDGHASAVMQNRSGVAQSGLRSFTISSKQADSFFTHLKAVKDAPATTGGCMKSASFGSSTIVHWQGWTSPDLNCPSEDPAIKALANDVSAIRTAAGISSFPLIQRPAADGPLHAGSPPPQR
ncbi:MAG TPA: hypothetical protein VGF18_02000 [Candidatus Tumulicola sp.]